MPTDYDSLIDHTALAEAQDRHDDVCRRMDVAQKRIRDAETARARVALDHDAALAGEAGDVRETAKRLRDADDLLKLAIDAPPAIDGAIRRSANLLRSERGYAHRALRNAAVAGLLASGQEIDRLRGDLIAAIQGHNAAVAALDTARANNVVAPNVSPIPAAAFDALRRLPGTPDGDLAAHLARLCHGTHPEIAALVEGA